MITVERISEDGKFKEVWAFTFEEGRFQCQVRHEQVMDWATVKYVERPDLIPQDVIDEAKQKAIELIEVVR